MVLCEKCRSLRDWREDPVVLNRIARNVRAPDEMRSKCGDCRQSIQNPFFRLHRRCARIANLCQHCSGEITDQDLERDAAE